MEIEDVYRSARRHNPLLKSRPCAAVTAAVIALLSGFVGGLFYQRHVARDETRPVAPTAVGASRLEGEIPIEYEEKIDLRINPDAPCKEPECFKCKWEITPPVEIKTAKHCSNDSNVYNHTCFQCENKCLNTSALLRKSRCGGDDINTCCVLAQMGDLIGECENGGHYECHPDPARPRKTAKEPICKCPPGWQGHRCQDYVEESISCKCYKVAYQFCNQEKMVDCDRNDKTEDWNHCLLHIEGVKRKRCICQRPKGKDELNNTERCSEPIHDAHLHSEEGTSCFAEYRWFYPGARSCMTKMPGGAPWVFLHQIRVGVAKMTLAVECHYSL